MVKISVRGVDDQALRRLRQVAARRGLSSNQLIADLLNGPDGKRAAPAEHTDLDALAGTWSTAEARNFDRATATFGQVDARLWR